MRWGGIRGLHGDEGAYLRGDTANLDKAEPHHHELLGSFALLVASGSETKRVAELAPQNCRTRTRVWRDVSLTSNGGQPAAAAAAAAAATATAAAD